uniref:Uncharacterized protein n=1 Tax=Oryza barthii TaxID=65489 RepID=A0A0D3FJR3_9ORYZ
MWEAPPPPSSSRRTKPHLPVEPPNLGITAAGEEVLVARPREGEGEEEEKEKKSPPPVAVAAVHRYRSHRRHLRTATGAAACWEGGGEGADGGGGGSVVEGDVVELVDRREEICACCMVKAGSWRMRSRQDLQKMARHMSTEKAGTRGC